MSIPRIPQLQGNPIWFNLATPDPAAAKDFYAALFGWEWADVPMSTGNTYHMAIKRRREHHGDVRRRSCQRYRQSVDKPHLR